MTEVQTTQQRELRDAIDAHDRLMAELKVQAEAKAIKLDEKYQALKEQIRTRHEAAWQAMAESLARGDAARRRGARRDRARGRRLRPALGRPGLGDRGRSRASSRPWSASARSRSTSRDLPAGSRPTPG